MSNPIPPLTVNPLALSLEHHLLRVLNLSSPTTRAEAIRKVQQRYPAMTRLGTPERPTPAAAHAWQALISAGWCRYVQQGARHGHVLTGLAEGRLQQLWRQQVESPYIESLRATHGDEVARRVAEELED